MDFSRALFDDKEGLLLLNDRLGSLYVYDFDRVKLVHKSRDQIKVRSPYIRRSITRHHGRIIYSDGHDTYIFEPPDALLPVDLPPGHILDDELICHERSYFIISTRKAYEVDGRITACKYLDGPAIAYVKNYVTNFVYAGKRIRIRNDLISFISCSFLGTLKGLLISIEPGVKLELGGSVRCILEDKETYVLVRRNGRSLVFRIADGEIIERKPLKGRFNALVKIDDTILAVGERIEEVLKRVLFTKPVYEMVPRSPPIRVPELVLDFLNAHHYHVRAVSRG